MKKEEGRRKMEDVTKKPLNGGAERLVCFGKLNSIYQQFVLFYILIKRTEMIILPFFL
jgi:hypothetical protein